MKFLDNNLSPLGLGCWPMGGKMFAADGTSLGYSNSNDSESINTIHAALANGINVFDTATAYGAGHSERLLATALKSHPEAVVITKIGIGIDEQTRTLTGEELGPETVIPAIDRSLKRLERESIDVVLLHPNNIPHEQANLVFDQMQKTRQMGKIKSFGWSTDFVSNVTALKDRDGFMVVEHAMHVLMDAPKMQSIVHDEDLLTLIRSPLAMGLLSGKYTAESIMPKDDIRATKQDWTGYYIDGKPNPDYLTRFAAIRELLQSDGRTPVQGALAWLWGKSDNNIPVPGARTVEQVEGLAGAIALGALSENVMKEIDDLLDTHFISDGESAR